MKRGFTLLELIVVIIILGILATLGFGQYMRMVERARGAEAKMILGTIRTQAVGRRMQYGTIAAIVGPPAVPAFGNADAGIGVSAEQIPSACTTTHYFSYTVTSVVDPTLVATAIRCTASGKVPNATTALTLILTSNLLTGADAWTGTGSY